VECAVHACVAKRSPGSRVGMRACVRACGRACVRACARGVGAAPAPHASHRSSMQGTCREVRTASLPVSRLGVRGQEIAGCVLAEGTRGTSPRAAARLPSHTISRTAMVCDARPCRILILCDAMRWQRAAAAARARCRVAPLLPRQIEPLLRAYTSRPVSPPVSRRRRASKRACATRGHDTR
jgi:hypothetical protein